MVKITWNGLTKPLFPIENESAPIELAQCWFPGGWHGRFQCKKYKYIFSNKIYGSNFVKQHSETAMALKLPKCCLQFKKNCCVIYYNFRYTFVPYALQKYNGQQCFIHSFNNGFIIKHSADNIIIGIVFFLFLHIFLLSCSQTIR